MYFKVKKLDKNLIRSYYLIKYEDYCLINKPEHLVFEGFENNKIISIRKKDIIDYEVIDEEDNNRSTRLL